MDIVKTPKFTSFKSLLNQKVIGKNDLLLIPVGMLEEEEGFNQRDYADPDVIAQIEKFAVAYAAGSFVPPPIVRLCIATQRILMVEGHLRRRGLRLALERGAQITQLHCVPFRGNDADRVEVMLKSAQGLPLTPVAVAQGYLMLLRMGNKASEIARRMNRSLSHVEDMLVLATANTDVQKMVLNGSVLQTNAIAAVRKYGDNAGPYLATELAKAKTQGKVKVTASSLKSWLPSAKLMRGIFDSAHPLIQTLGQDVVRVIASADQDNISSLKGKTVQVDAHSLAQLFLAMRGVDDAKLRHDQRVAQNIEKNKQNSLDCST